MPTSQPIVGNRQRISKKEASTIPRSSGAGGARRAPTPAARIHSAEKRRKTEWNSYQSCGSSLRYCIQTLGSPRPLGALCSCSPDGRCDENKTSCRPLSWRRVRLHVGLKPCSNIESTAAATCEVSIEPVIANGLAAKRRGRASALASLFLDKCFEFIRCHSGTLGDYSPLLSRDIRRLTKFRARRY